MFKALRVFPAIMGLVMILVAGLPTVFQQQPVPTQPPIIIEPPIIIDPPPRPIGGVFTNPEWMSIDHHRVTITVDNQIATTNVDMQFTNNGSGFVEGTFLFPLPDEAAVDNLVMYINGQAIEARILRADEARAVYDEIVRQYRDPALLEYVGRNTIQANVFPIPPGESRRIELGYTQILEADNGLIKLTYPMANSATKGRTVNSMSLSVNVTSADAISNIYSPSHNVAISREGESAFRVGFEQNDFPTGDDFVLYYGLANDRISVNLLTYRESATEDGFFMLLVQPPVNVPDEQIVPKDVIIVLDQSGSMDGTKWEQAQNAAAYVLDNLNEEDRFNVIAFSTGWRVFGNGLEPASVAPEARDWVYNLFAEGGTDINGALTTAVELADPERPTTILFMTDGLATEGVTDTPSILSNISASAPSNVRIFTFGVGDDVDTLLLGSITRDFRGASSYVRPSENIEEEVASLYNKVAAPVLTNLTLDMGGVRTDFLYPTGELPDLFAGEQLTVVGRYRDNAQDITLTLAGEVNGEAVSYTYDGYEFRERAGGEPFIARLWATRRIGELLNNIQLNGENEELVNSVVNLSVRYGIITPYTSFLIDESDILSQQGRARAEESLRRDAQALGGSVSGAAAVNAADAFADLSAANAPAQNQVFAPSPAATMNAVPAAPAGSNRGGFGSAPVTAPTDSELESNAFFSGDDQQQAEAAPIITVAGKTFILQDGVYTDTTYDPDTMTTEKIAFLSDAYFDLLTQSPELAEYLAIGDALIVVYEGVAYEITPTA